MKESILCTGTGGFLSVTVGYFQDAKNTDMVEEREREKDVKDSNE